MEVGKYSVISLYEAVESAKEMLLLQDNTEFDSFFLRKADEAMRHVGDQTSYVKKACTVDIVDGRAKLPMGFIRLLGLRFADSNGNCFDQPYLDTDFLVECGCDNVVGSYGDYFNPFQIDDGYVVFNEPGDVEAVTAKIAFIGRNVDDNGLMVMSERHERAVEAYLCYSYATAYFREFPKNIRDDYYKTWKNQKTQIRGRAARERFEENKREIGAILNAWIISDRNDRV